MSFRLEPPCSDCAVAITVGSGEFDAMSLKQVLLPSNGQDLLEVEDHLSKVATICCYNPVKTFQMSDVESHIQSPSSGTLLKIIGKHIGNTGRK